MWAKPGNLRGSCLRIVLLRCCQNVMSCSSRCRPVSLLIRCSFPLTIPPWCVSLWVSSFSQTQWMQQQRQQQNETKKIYHSQTALHRGRRNCTPLFGIVVSSLRTCHRMLSTFIQSLFCKLRYGTRCVSSCRLRKTKNARWVFVWAPTHFT